MLATQYQSIPSRSKLTPVVVALWNSGVDTATFPGRIWTNAKEIPGNGKDDDGNGYVDDVHGFAWTWDGEPTTSDLRRLELSPADLARAKQNLYGDADLQARIDSPEAQTMKRILAGMSKDEIKLAMESHRFYESYAHGTHVAGIATRGNPAAACWSRD